MLLNSFFNITGVTRDETNTKFNATIELNPQHPIYEGHFPGNPVVPGVCMQQMVKESLGLFLGKTLLLYKADIIKFLSVIIPENNKSFKLSINIKSAEADQLKIDSNISDEATIFFKYTALFKILS